MGKALDFKDLENMFKKARKVAPKVIEESLNASAEDLLSQSIDLAPLDEGGLRENGSVDPAKKERNQIIAKVGFSKEYALKMHEDFYTPSTPGTGRKYLEKPTHENAEKYVEYIASKVDKLWK
ncbi:hypothetical protein NSA56_01825 [Oceanobacillus caeni]|uniref:hypothetical protein n=1 Tax=Oceanobacillus caeni TaxID=405946 RepID=UPI002149C9B8|nr:hypothetical protein [Oceanobacillus caeni]MCR1833135.1 hypothetical protein [Oceanobacillus caeni]